MPQRLTLSTFPGTLHLSPHALALAYTHAGDIKIFKDMSITDMNLEGCRQLTGEWFVSWVGSRSAVCDAPTPHPLNLPGYLLHLSSLGDIDQLPKSITDLNLSDTKLEGR